MEDKKELVKEAKLILAKQEAIKKAWGEYYEKIKNELDENGWYCYFALTIKVMEKKLHQFNNLNLEDHDERCLIRPKLLKGIEYNNGWIKIESEDDLPKEDVECIYIDINKDYISDKIIRTPTRLKNLYKENYFTHLYIIPPFEIPKPPIY